MKEQAELYAVFVDNDCTTFSVATEFVEAYADEALANQHAEKLNANRGMYAIVRILKVSKQVLQEALNSLEPPKETD